MNIDERLDRLTERHEALTQTVEIIAGMQTRLEESLGQLTGKMNDLAVTMERLDEIDGGEAQ